MPIARPSLVRPLALLLAIAAFVAVFAAQTRTSRADFAIYDGDGILPIEFTIGAHFGTVECGVPIDQQIVLAVARGVKSSFLNGITYQNSATITFTAAAPVHPDLALAMPASPNHQVTLPANWYDASWGTLSPTVLPVLTLTPDSPGLHITAISFTASGINRNGQTFNAPAIMAVTWYVPHCVELEITKTDTPDPVIAGSGPGNLEYTVEVTNHGPHDATGLVLQESINLPAGVTIDSVTPSGTTSFDDNTGEWTIGTLPNGDTATLVLVLTVGADTTPAGLDAIVNSVSVADINEPYGGDSWAEQPTSVLRESNLLVVKSATATPPVTPGADINYQLDVTNAGPSNATNTALLVRDILPAGFKNVVFGANGPWACTVSGVTITCTRTGPGAGESMPVGTEIIRYRATSNPSALPPGDFTNTVNVEVTPIADLQLPDPDLAGAANASAFSLAIGAPMADVAVYKSIAPLVPMPGQEVTYRVRVRSLGPSTAVDVVMNDQLPAGFVFKGWVGASTGCNSPAVGAIAPLLTCSRASMLPGTSTTWTFKAIVPTGPDGRQRNNATVSSSTYDPKPANNTAAEAASLP